MIAVNNSSEEDLPVGSETKFRSRLWALKPSLEVIEISLVNILHDFEYSPKIRRVQRSILPANQFRQFKCHELDLEDSECAFYHTMN
jgi:hypothetical protein